MQDRYGGGTGTLLNLPLEKLPGVFCRSDSEFKASLYLQRRKAEESSDSPVLFASALASVNGNLKLKRLNSGDCVEFLSGACPDDRGSCPLQSPAKHSKSNLNPKTPISIPSFNPRTKEESLRLASESSTKVANCGPTGPGLSEQIKIKSILRKGSSCELRESEPSDVHIPETSRDPYKRALRILQKVEIVAGSPIKKDRKPEKGDPKEQRPDGLPSQSAQLPASNTGQNHKSSRSVYLEVDSMREINSYREEKERELQTNKQDRAEIDLIVKNAAASQFEVTKSQLDSSRRDPLIEKVSAEGNHSRKSRCSIKSKSNSEANSEMFIQRKAADSRQSTSRLSPLRLQTNNSYCGNEYIELSMNNCLSHQAENSARYFPEVVLSSGQHGLFSLSDGGYLKSSAFETLRKKLFSFIKKIDGALPEKRILAQSTIEVKDFFDLVAGQLSALKSRQQDLEREATQIRGEKESMMRKVEELEKTVRSTLKALEEKERRLRSGTSSPALDPNSARYFSASQPHEQYGPRPVVSRDARLAGQLLPQTQNRMYSAALSRLD